MKRNSDSDDDRKMPAKTDNQPLPDQRGEAADEKSTSGAAGILDASPGSVAQKQPPVAAAAAAKQNEKPAKRKPGTNKQANKSSKKAKSSQQQRGPLPPSHLPGYNFRPHDNLTLSGGRQSVKYVVKSSFAPEVIARAAGTEKHGRSPGSSRHEDTEVPENETAEEKRLRRNRINERRKRARRAMKIDYLNEQYHNITTDNERIREENQLLRDQIEDVRNGRMPQGFQDNEGAAQDRENMVGTADDPPDVASSSAALADTTALACLQQPQAQAQTAPLPESDLARALAILHGTQQSISHSTADTEQPAVQPQVPTQNSGTSQLLLESALATLLQRGLQQSETSSTVTQGMAQQGSGMLTGASQANENIRNTMGIRENTATDSHSRNTTGSTVALLQSLLSRESFNSAAAVGNPSTRNSTTSSTTGTVGSGSMRHSAAVAPTATSTSRGLAAPPLAVTSSASSAEQNLLVLLSDHLQQQDQTAGASFNATLLSRLQDALSTTASQESRQPEPAQSSNARPVVPHSQQGALADTLALILQQQQRGAVGNSQVQVQGQRHVQQHGQPVNQNQLQQLESSLQQLLRGRQQPGGAAAAPGQRVVEHQQNQEQQRRSELQEQLQQLVLQNERQQQQRQDQQSSQIQELQRLLALQEQQQEEEQRRQRQEFIQIQELRQLLVLQQQQERQRQQEQQQEQQRQQQRERQQLQIGMERQRQQENIRIRELQQLLLLQQQRQGQGQRENASTVRSSPLQQLHRHHAQASNAAPAPPPSPLNTLSGGIDLRQLLLQQRQDAGTNARLQPAARHDMSASSAGPGEESKTGIRIDFKAEDHNYEDGPKQK